jgi:hypothetical protein
MAKTTKRVVAKSKDSIQVSEKSNQASLPKCLDIAGHGISTSRDFAKFMSALMTDIVEARVSPGVANAACNAGGKLLKVVEMQVKYGTQGKGTGANQDLVLAPEGVADPFALTSS